MEKSVSYACLTAGRRQIEAGKIKKAVAELAQKANYVLPVFIQRALKSAYIQETNKRAKKILKAIIDNAAIARNEKLAICQDTGLPVVFMEVGQDVHIRGGSLVKAINQGIELGYRRGYLRDSIVRDPILRGKPGFAPAVIHTEITAGDRIKLTVMPKGFGCENKSQIKMFKPTASISEIKKFIIEAVKNSGPDACPPFIVGVGIGGTQDYACLLAKKALLPPAARRPPPAARFGIRNAEYGIRALENELLMEINKLNIGPMGLGGKTTALAVKILAYPTHIAGLPVAVNISCHALRSAEVIV